MNNRKSDDLRNLSILSHLGFLMTVPIIACVLLGAYLDRLFGSKVIFLLIFTLLGVLAAFRNLYVVSMKGIKRAERNRSNEEE